ncbi:phage major capsid protein [Micromonospora zamorensis]|uniref:phage major capsid protein n=1 Tax=Micromonospora zamorensis TaxID=709883 RepID=UPI0037211F63
MTLAQMLAAAQETLRAKIAARAAAQDALMALRSAPDLTVDAVTEQTRVRDDADAAIDAARAEVERLEAEVAREAEVAALSERTTPGAPRPTGGARVTSEPEVYRKTGEVSYFRDLYRAQHMNNRDSVERLVRNDRAMADNTEYRALTTVDGAGGDFVPPLWMVQDFIQLARAGRVVADQVRQQNLPGGTDTISLPRLATGTAVAEQATQNTQVQSTDATTNSVSAAVTTIAGEQVISQQLLDQSPVNMDDVLLADLAADYAIKLDTFAISNNATNKVGLLNVSGANAITYTDASPTVGELWAKIADGIQQISTGRLMPPDKGFMHPRRWAWFTAALDTAGRPLIGTNGPQNAIGTNGPNVAQGYLGNFQGIDWYGDPNIPANLGAGTNEDRMIIMRSTDVILYEGTPRSETFRETLARQLSVVLRFYNYAALHASRYPKSISVISGTGLITPTF